MRLDLSGRWPVLKELERLVNHGLDQERIGDAYSASLALSSELRTLATSIEENFSICLRKGLERTALAQANMQTIRRTKKRTK